MPKPIYLDYNATTPHDPEVIAAMRPFLETEFGNPSSSHAYGAAPRKAIDKARRQVGTMLNCRPREVIFTSGGSESNNHAIKGIAWLLKEKGNHIITSSIEHPAVLEVCRYLASCGFETTYLPVDRQGMVNIVDVEKAIRPDTILVSIMHANNEVGTIQPIAEIAGLAKKHGIITHTDAAQSCGKIPTDVYALGVDLLSMAGHKLYAPKGVGALYIRETVDPGIFCHGAAQEMGWRAGTENVLEIVGLGQACEIAAEDMEKKMVPMIKLRDRFHNGLRRRTKDIRLNGHPDERLPNTLSLCFKGLEANRILEEISESVAASAGAACHSGQVAVSPVLEAMGIPLDWAKGTLRFSLGRMTTIDEIDTAIDAVVRAVDKLRR